MRELDEVVVLWQPRNQQEQQQIRSRCVQGREDNWERAQSVWKEEQLGNAGDGQDTFAEELKLENIS